MFTMLGVSIILMYFLPYLHDKLSKFITAKECIQVFVAMVFLEHLQGVRLFNNLK